MKKLLLLLIICLPLLVRAQATLQLKHDTLSVWVGQYEHPLNTLRVRFLDSDSTMAVWGIDNTVFAPARKYNAYTDDSNTPFASLSALKSYVRQYFFVDASNGGGGAVGGDLQSVTNEGNTTDNALMSTGANNFPSDKDGALMIGGAFSSFLGAKSGSVFNGATFNGDYSFNIGEASHNLFYVTGGGIYGFVSNGSFARVQGSRAVDTSDFVTLKQAQEIGNLYTGWGAYQDTVYSQSSPFILASGAKRTLPNRAQLKIESQKPIDVTTFYRASDSTITGRSGDGLNIYVEFVAVPDGSTTYLQTSVDIGGVVGELYNQVFTFPNGASVPQRVSFSFSGYTLDTWQANGAKVKVMSDGQCNLYGMRYVLTRTHKAR